MRVPDLSPLYLSLLVAATATIIVAPIGLLAAWWVSGVGGKGGRAARLSVVRLLVETLFTLPLVLPPTVVGFVLLLVLGRGTVIGRFLNENVGIRLVFTWQGASLAAAVMALPLLTRTVDSAFRAVDPELMEAGRTLGATESQLFASVLLPLSFRGVLAGMTLAFARALGEFGATLMVAGMIPGRTETLPLAIYNAVQNGDNADAIFYAAVVTAIAFFLLGTTALIGGRIAFSRGDAR